MVSLVDLAFPVGVRGTEESSSRSGSEFDRCGCGQRTVRECRSGCWGSDGRDCGGSCDGSGGIGEGYFPTSSSYG